MDGTGGIHCQGWRMKGVMGAKPYWYERCVSAEVANQFARPPLTRAMTEREAVAVDVAMRVADYAINSSHDYLSNFQGGENFVDVGSLFVAAYQVVRQCESLKAQHIALGGTWPD
jgi:hypothetical protein